MRDVVIVAGCRTPIGTIGVQFKTLAPVELTIPVMQNLIKRAGIDPVIIDDVIWGCNYQRTYKENNLARVAAVKAGLPVTVPHPCLPSRWDFIRSVPEKQSVSWQEVLTA